MRSFRSAIALFAGLAAIAACSQPAASTGDGADADALAGTDADVATGSDGDAVDAGDIGSATDTLDAAATDAVQDDAAPSDADAADAQDGLDAEGVDTQDDAGTAADGQPDSPPECTKDSDCDDSVACTLDACAANVCTHTLQDGPCDDGNPCTGADTCHKGTCSGDKIACPGTVCGNGILEAGEDCDFAGAASVCCDAKTCTTLPGSPTETEPNNSKVGLNLVKDDIAGGSAVANETCGTIDGQFQPDQMFDNWDADFFKFYVAAPSTVYVEIVDPTGGDGCVWKKTAGVGWVFLDTQLAAFDSALVQMATNNDKAPGNACSALVINAATPGWYYAGTMGYGSDAQNNDVNQPYRLLTKIQAWKCGDGVKQENEACDGADLGKTTCVTLGYTGGTLACTPGCGLDTGACTGTQPGTEPNDDFTTATPMGSLIAGHLGGGVDYYKIDLPAGAVLTATTSDPLGGNACGTATVFPPLADLNTQLALYGPDQQQLTSNDDIHAEYPPFDAAANFCSSVTWSVATAGTYYLAVTGAGQLTVTDPVTGLKGYPVGYALNVTVTPWTCVDAPGLPCELPDNHTPATAMPIVSAVAGVVSSPGQADYFKFQVDTDGTLIAASIRDGGVPAMAGQPTCAAGQIDTQLVILAQDATTVLGQNDNISAVNLCSAVTLTLAAGTYYAVVSSQNPNQAMPYALHIGRGAAKWVTAVAGGTVQMPAGLTGAGTTVSIPPGALAEDTLITIIGGVDIAFADGTLIGTPIELGPTGTTFGAPVTVSLTGVAPTLDTRVVLHRHEATGQVDLLIPDPNTAPDVATVTVDSFSTLQPAATAQPMIAWNKKVFHETYDNNGQIGEIIARCINCTINVNGTYNWTLNDYLGSVDAVGNGVGTCAINTPSVASTHAQIYNINTIGWTLITTDFNLDSSSNFGPFTCQFTDGWHDTPTTTVTPFTTVGGLPLPTSQILQAKSTFSLAFYDTPTLTSNISTFQHAAAADGTVPTVVTLTLNGGEEFKAKPGTVLPPTIASYYDLPRFTGDWTQGLTPQIKVTGPTTAQVTFTGMSAPPILHAGIVDFSAVFIPADFKHFTWPAETAVPLHLDWHARELHVSRYFYNENAPLNDGTITTTGTFTLEGDTFTAAPGTHIGTFTGVPAGLVADLVVTSPTTAKLSFSGKATDPVDGDWSNNTLNAAVINDVSVQFADGDFTAGQAALLTGANRDDLHIVMYRFPGFVYTGLSDGGNIALEAYDFGAGPRYLYWQPILREGGLYMNHAQTESCAEPNLGCQLKNFGVEDRLAFALEGGANPHKIAQSGKASGCKKPGSAADALAYCGMDKWYPYHPVTQLRVVGNGQAVVYDNFIGALEMSADGKQVPPNPALIGTTEPNPDPNGGPPIQTCPYDKVCCGYESPYWEQHDVGNGTTGYAGPFPKWPADPIDFYSGWTALSSWGWDIGNHPLPGGPTDKFVFDWYSGKGVWVNLLQELNCPDVRLENGKRVDLCDGAGYEAPGLFHSEVKLFGFPLEWTTKCTGQWATGGAVCLSMYDPSSFYGGCYGQVTGNPTGNYPRFY